MARGIIRKWKMPIYCSFDSDMTKETMDMIVRKLESEGFCVYGVAFDLGNKKFQNEVRFHEGVHKLQNPHDAERPFFLVPDVPHCLKNLRSHLLDKTFIIPKDPLVENIAPPTKNNVNYKLEVGDVVELGKQTFQAILEVDGPNEFKIHHKLKESHLDVSASARCNVRVAAQTLSASTAAALRYLGPQYEPQAKAIQIVNDVSIELSTYSIH